MLQSLINIKLAAMVAALGLDTGEWSSPSNDMVNNVSALSQALKDASEGKPSPAGKGLQETINAIKELADKKGDKDALYAVGLFLQQSNQQGTLPQVLEYYKKAADLDQLQAMNNYGYLIAASSQEPERTKEGIGWIKKAADKGLNAARRNMASIYLRGMAGENQDIAAAEKLLETASKAKDPQADFELAQFYSGAGGEAKKDDKKAYAYLQAAADAGNPSALEALGSLLFEGRSLGSLQVPKNPELAVEKFQKLAEKNVPAGLRIMAQLHEGGTAGVAKDFNKALEYYTRAAQGNDAVAQVRLASFYDQGVDLADANGKGDGKLEVARNDAAALQLYRMAAQNNVPLAMFNVGAFYEGGRSVDKDPAKAFAYFLQSAVSGFIYGMQKTGVYYLNGAGVSKDPVAAAGWFARGAAAGLPDSSLSLGIVTELGVSLPSDQKTPPAFTAGGLYLQAADSVAASDAVRMEALLRLGNLYLRGAMVPSATDAPKPNFERAYLYFKQASKIDPTSTLASKLADEAKAKLTVAEKTKAEADVDRREADLKSRKAAAANPQAAAAPPAATPAAPAAPAAPPAATPVTPRVRTPAP